ILQENAPRPANSRGSAGRDAISRFEQEQLAQVFDELVDGKQEIPGIAILHKLAVYRTTNGELVGIGNELPWGDAGAHRSKTLPAFAQHPIKSERPTPAPIRAVLQVA